MSKKLNITPGEVYTTVQDPAFLNFEIRLRGDDMRLVATMGIDCSPEEEAANATLYADAHNTYNKCQMLPSELLSWSQIKEFLKDQVERKFHLKEISVNPATTDGVKEIELHFR